MGMFPVDFIQRHILKHLIDPAVAGRRIPASDHFTLRKSVGATPAILIEIY